MPDMYNFVPQSNIVAGSVVVFLLAVIAAVLVAAFFLPKTKKHSYSGFLKGLYEFLHFEKYWIPSLARFLYLFICCYALINGVYLLFAVNFFYGLAVMVFTPLVARLLIEGLLVLYSIRDEMIRIRKGQEKKDQDETEE